MPISKSTRKVNVMVHKNKAKSEPVESLYDTWHVPITSKWEKAVNNNHFTMWPGLNSRLSKNKLQPFLAISQKYLQQDIKEELSTKYQYNPSLTLAS